MCVRGSVEFKYTQEVMSHVQVTETNSPWNFQRRIHKQISINCNSWVK
jgi:hypothetical protein